MKYILAVVCFFCAALAAGHQVLERKSNHITLMPISQESFAMFAVLVDNAEDGDEAVVDVCYWTTFPGVQSKLVRCKTSVIPVFAGVPSATDEVPVGMESIQTVKVRIVRTIEREKFAYKELEP